MPAEPISTPHAPPALGPYSPAVRAGEWVILSGQGGFDPATGKLVAGGVEAETRQTFVNITAILGDCGLTLRDVAKALVFVADINDFPKVNAVYAEAFGDHKPARSTVQAAALPGGCQVEIEVWAHA